MAQDPHDISALRREYEAGGLHRADLSADPVEQFAHWFNEAVAVYADAATAMTLATADAQGMPAARIVLLKRFSAEGFAWFTDYRSDKGRELAENPQAELLFFWPELERQVRIRGRVQKLARAEAEAYFNQRPLGSRLSASVSCQSAPAESRAQLEMAVASMSECYPDGNVPCPEQWGGYLLLPQRFEFWQGRPSRLHDRFIYAREADHTWAIQRLQP